MAQKLMVYYFLPKPSVLSGAEGFAAKSSRMRENPLGERYQVFDMKGFLG